MSGRIALIPGANRPIGKAIAELFASKGALLVLPVYDWPESTTAMTREFTDKGYQFTTLPADLRVPADCRLVANLIAEQYGHLDYLINNIERGGMPVVHGSYELPHNDQQWDLEFNTTVKAKYLLYSSCKHLFSESDGGAIINISSIAGEVGRSGSAGVFFSDGYSSANRAIQSFTQTWAREMSPHVRVNELQLGLINTRHGDNTRGWGVLTEEQKTQLLANILLARTGAPGEVAEAVFFLAVTAGYCTGACLRLDGGYILGNAAVSPLPPGIL